MSFLPDFLKGVGTIATLGLQDVVEGAAKGKDIGEIAKSAGKSAVYGGTGGSVDIEQMAKDPKKGFLKMGTRSLEGGAAALTALTAGGASPLSGLLGGASGAVSGGTAAGGSAAGAATSGATSAISQGAAQGLSQGAAQGLSQGAAQGISQGAIQGGSAAAGGALGSQATKPLSGLAQEGAQSLAEEGAKGIAQQGVKQGQIGLGSLGATGGNSSLADQAARIGQGQVAPSKYGYHTLTEGKMFNDGMGTLGGAESLARPAGGAENVMAPTADSMFGPSAAGPAPLDQVGQSVQNMSQSYQNAQSPGFMEGLGFRDYLSLASAGGTVASKLVPPPQPPPAMRFGKISGRGGNPWKTNSLT